MLKVLGILAAIIVVLIFLVFINMQGADYRLVAPCTNKVVRSEIIFPRALNYHFVLLKNQGRDVKTDSEADIAGKIMLEDADKSQTFCLFNRTTVKRCNWFDSGTNRNETYVVYLTRSSDTNLVSLESLVVPGKQYHVQFEFESSTITNYSIWLDWVTTLYIKYK
jgi:hypothetical protein